MYVHKSGVMNGQFHYFS